MDTKQIERLASSAKLKFNQADVKFWQERMASIFTWLDAISAVDTSSVGDIVSHGEAHIRRDEASVFPGAQALVSAFTESEDNMAKVKKVL